jgi:uncharacterized protein YktB (UPF0637 family)
VQERGDAVINFEKRAFHSENQSHHHPSPLHLDELRNTLQERAASKRGELERGASLNQEERRSKRLDQLIVDLI